MSLFKVFDVSGTALTAQSQRLNTIASNLANAESVTSATGETYRAKHVVFSSQPLAAPDAVGVRVTGVVEDNAPPRRVHDLVGGAVQDLMVEGFHADADPLVRGAGQRKSPRVNELRQVRRRKIIR